MMATVQHKILQHFWPSICKPRAKDRNIIGCNMLHAFGATLLHEPDQQLQNLATSTKKKKKKKKLLENRPNKMLIGLKSCFYNLIETQN